MIKAECYSDDRCIEVEFDATAWFKAATDSMILALVKCGWCHDYAADAVAEYIETDNPKITEMFTYIRLRQRIETIGFECSVNEADAMEWLKTNRPALHMQILNQQ